MTYRNVVSNFLLDEASSFSPTADSASNFLFPDGTPDIDLVKLCVALSGTAIVGAKLEGSSPPR